MILTKEQAESTRQILVPAGPAKAVVNIFLVHADGNNICVQRWRNSQISVIHAHPVTKHSPPIANESYRGLDVMAKAYGLE